VEFSIKLPEGLSRSG